LLLVKYYLFITT